MAERKDKKTASRNNTAKNKKNGVLGLFGKKKTSKNTSRKNTVSKSNKNTTRTSGSSYTNPYSNSPYGSSYGSTYSSYGSYSPYGNYGSRRTYSSTGGYSTYSSPFSSSGDKKAQSTTKSSSKKTTKKKTGLFGKSKTKNKNTKKTTGTSHTAKSSTTGTTGTTGYGSYGSSYGSYGGSYSGYNSGYGSSYNRSYGSGGYSTYTSPFSSGTSGVKKETQPKKQTTRKKKKKRNSAIGDFAIGGLRSILNSAMGGSGQVIDLKRNRMALGVYIFIAVLIGVYLTGYTVRFLSRNVVNYDTIAYGSVDTPTSFTGVIIRDEEVYKTPAAGVISYEVTDADRVKKGTTVCTVKDEESLELMEENLDAINESIFKMQQEREDISIYSEDIARANEQIKNLVDNAAFSFAGGDVSSLYELRSNVQKKLDNRNQMLLTENKGALTELVSQREAAQSEIDKNTTTIAANSGGVVSYYTDGLEDTYKVDTMTDLTKEQTLEGDKSESGFKNSVKENDSVFKLVKSNMWYIAVYMPNEEITDWEEGDHENLYVKDSTGEDFTLDAVVQSLEDKGVEKLVIMEITKDMESFMNNRSISFETSMPKTGYKVANSAIVEETSLQIPADYVENENTVYKVENGSVSKVEINISGSDTETGVVYITLNLNELNVGDVLRKPDDATAQYTISDTMTIKGIFVMNSGIAEFKKINTTNSISNSTHTVLDVSLNNNIQIYDRVITDTSNIQKQQKVYS